jgi:hypothetical protein
MRATCRRAALAIVIAMEGCGGGDEVGAGDAQVDAASDAAIDAAPWPALFIDVRYAGGRSLWVTASDPARTQCTFYGFLRDGCEDVIDARGCSRPLAPWVSAVHLTSGGEVIASRTPVDLWEGVAFLPAVVEGHGDLVVVLEASDGQRAEIPIPEGVVAPQPTIEAATYAQNEVHVAWSATPAPASTMISFQRDLHGHRCHVAAPQAEIVIPWFDRSPDYYSVETFAAAPSIVTPLGDARVWIGGSAGMFVPSSP